MSLERGEKTLGINKWKCNQDGFKDGVCAGVRASVCACISTDGLYSLPYQHFKRFLSSVRVWNMERGGPQWRLLLTLQATLTLPTCKQTDNTN